MAMEEMGDDKLKNDEEVAPVKEGRQWYEDEEAEEGTTRRKKKQRKEASELKGENSAALSENKKI
jgi:hypothetical protein